MADFNKTELLSAVQARLLIEKSKGRTQSEIGAELGLSQSYISALNRGRQYKADELKISLYLAMDLCDWMDRPYNDFGIKHARAVNFEMKTFYILSVSHHTDPSSVVGVKYGCQTTDDDNRVDKVNGEKPFFDHRLVAKWNMEDNSVACALETGVKRKYGRDTHGEYCWVPPKEVFEVVEEIVWFWPHERRIAPEWQAKLGINQ